MQNCGPSVSSARACALDKRPSRVTKLRMRRSVGSYNIGLPSVLVECWSDMLDLFGVSLPAKPGKKKGTAIRCRILERVKGIEPSSRAWEAFVLPLNYTRNRCVLYRGAMGQVETGCVGGHDPVASVPCRSASC